MSTSDSYEYDAYVNEFTVSGGSSTPNNYLYRGEQFDPDLGLYYLRVRYYNPATGRFMSRDPEDGNLTDPASLHRYLYADGNPVNLSDPSGRWSIGPIKFKGATVEYTLLLGPILGTAAQIWNAGVAIALTFCKIEAALDLSTLIIHRTLPPWPAIVCDVVGVAF